MATPPRSVVGPSRAPARSNYSAFAAIYDVLTGDPAQAALGRAFRRAARRMGLRIAALADAGCGTGRFLESLASSRAALYGVDRSAEALAIARTRLAPDRARFLRQDIRALRLPRRVDAVTCHNQTVNYLLSRAGLLRAFRAVAGNLKPRGAFLFDFIARPEGAARARPYRTAETFRLPGGETRFESLVDAARGRSTVTVTIRAGRDSASAMEIHRQRWYRPETIARLLRRAGFESVAFAPVSRRDMPYWLYTAARRE